MINLGLETLAGELNSDAQGHRESRKRPFSEIEWS